MSILSSYRSRERVALVDKDLETIKKIKTSNRIENRELSKLNQVISSWNNKTLVKRLIKEVIFDLNKEYDESKDAKLEQIIMELEKIIS